MIGIKNIKYLAFILLSSVSIIVASMYWHVTELRDNLISSNAINTARLYTTALNQFRAIYTSEVVSIASMNNLDVSHDYAVRDNAIPLPATLSMLLGEQIGNLTAGASSQLLSPYPFPWRNQGQGVVLDGFDQKAWNFLSEHSTEQYYEFAHDSEGITLHYAIADVMKADCVGCHNSHPSSPKTDWKVGDVRGILKVNLPLDVISLETTSNLLSTISIYITVGVGLVFIVGLVIIKLSRHSKTLEQKVIERTKELESEILERKNQEERFRIGIEASPAAMIMTDDNGKILYTNTEANRVFSYPVGELIDKSIELLVPNKHRGKHENLQKSFFQNPSPRSMVGRDLFAQKMNGDIFPVEIGITPIETSNGMLVLCAVTDLTERKAVEGKILEQSKLLQVANERLLIESTVDSLTNIANRRSLITQLDIFLKLSRRHNRPISILMADIDYFKEYNDALGHLAGDSALKKIAQKIDAAKRDADFVGRYGGEEFVIILPDTDAEGAILAGEKIRMAIESISTLERKVTASLGATTLNISKDDQFEVQNLRELLIQNADDALYHSKKNGRNMVSHSNMLN